MGYDDINAKNNRGDTPLHMAAKTQFTVHIISALVEAGADPNAKNNRGDTPLHIAAEKNRSGAVRVLVEAGADPNAKNNERKTPLSIARDKGSHSIVFELSCHALIIRVKTSMSRQT